MPETRPKPFLSISHVVQLGCGLPVLVVLLGLGHGALLMKCQRAACHAAIAMQPQGLWTSITWPLETDGPFVIGMPMTSESKYAALARQLNSHTDSDEHQAAVIPLRAINLGKFPKHVDGHVQVSTRRSGTTGTAWGMEIAVKDLVGADHELAKLEGFAARRRAVPPHSTVDMLVVVAFPAGTEFRYSDIVSVDIGEFAGGMRIRLEPTTGLRAGRK